MRRAPRISAGRTPAPARRRRSARSAWRRPVRRSRRPAYSGSVFDDQRDEQDRAVGRIDLAEARRRRQLRRQLAQRRGDVRLHVERGAVDVAVEVELHDDVGRAEHRRRGHHVDAGDRREGALERAGDRGRHRVRAGAGQRGGDRDGREVDARQRRRPEAGDSRTGRRRRTTASADCRHHRPADAEFGQRHVSSLRLAALRAATLAPSVSSSAPSTTTVSSPVEALDDDGLAVLVRADLDRLHMRDAVDDGEDVIAASGRSAPPRAARRRCSARRAASASGRRAAPATAISSALSKIGARDDACRSSGSTELSSSASLPGDAALRALRRRLDASRRRGHRLAQGRQQRLLHREGDVDRRDLVDGGEDAGGAVVDGLGDVALLDARRRRPGRRSARSSCTSRAAP